MKIFKSVCILFSVAILISACETQQEPRPSLRYGKPIYYQSTAVVKTIVGKASILAVGNTDGNAETARFGSLRSLVFDSKNNLFVVDNMFNQIRKITPDGQVSTFAGTGKSGYADGPGAAATFNGAQGIAIDVNDNLYIADYYNNCIRKITSGGDVTTFAGSVDGYGGNTDGVGTDARFMYPMYLAFDAQGNLYVTEYYKIRKITPAGVVTSLAGSDQSGYADGTGTSALFKSLAGIAVGPDGNIYVADVYADRIRKVTSAGVVTTFAGSGQYEYIDGTGTTASFWAPCGITADVSGNIFVTDQVGFIRKITPDAVVSTVAGGNGGPYTVDGVGCASSFAGPSGITHDASGNVYVADECVIRKITLQ